MATGRGPLARRLVSVCSAFLVLFVLAACGGQPDDSSPGGFDLDLDEGTTMVEVVNAFAVSERECILDVLGDELSVLGTRVLSEDDIAGEAMTKMFPCLAPDTARELFLAVFLAGFQSDGWITGIGADEEACLRERLDEFDVFDVVAAMEEADSEVPPAGILGLIGCFKDQLIDIMLPEDELASGGMTEERRLCLRDLLADTDWSVLIEALESDMESDDPAVLDFNLSMFACYAEPAFPFDEPIPTAVPAGTPVGVDLLGSATPVVLGGVAPGEVEGEGDVDFFVFEAEEGERYLIDVALGTLDDSVAVVYDPEGFELAYSDYFAGTFASRIYWEADYSGPHYVAVKGYHTGTGSYTLSVARVDATPVAVGGVAPGEVEAEGEVDFFVFEAEEGELYLIDVELETLGDFVIVVYDPEGFELAYNHDLGGVWASRIYREAESSGHHFVSVAGGRSNATGTYTLGIAAIEDDHSRFFARATPVAVGETTPGEMNYAGDRDSFVFEAEEGERYLIDVALGTLYDSVAGLYDSEGFELVSNDDLGGVLGSRIYWEADYSGPHYVSVKGGGFFSGLSNHTGTYTLRIVAR